MTSDRDPMADVTPPPDPPRAFIVDRPVAILMVFLAAVVFGYFSYGRLPVTLMPELSYPTLTVRTEYPDYAIWRDFPYEYETERLAIDLLAGGVDQLERHLDAVAVGLVEDELAITLERVGGGIQLARQRRVRDLLDADDDVHKGTQVTGASTSYPTRAVVPGAPVRRGTVGFLEDPAGRQLVRVVGDGSQHGHRAPPLEPRSRRRGGRDEPARARDACCSR